VKIQNLSSLPTEEGKRTEHNSLDDGNPIENQKKDEPSVVETFQEIVDLARQTLKMVCESQNVELQKENEVVEKENPLDNEISQ